MFRARAISLFAIFILCGSLISAGVALNRFYIQRDYAIFANVPCDPIENSCFVDTSEGSITFYAKVQKKASTIAPCDGWRDECMPLACTTGDPNCTETFCQPGGEETCYQGNPQN